MSIFLHPSEVHQAPHTPMPKHQKPLVHLLQSPDLQSLTYQNQTARLIAEIYGVYPLPNPIACCQCVEEISAFIDWEQEEGPAEAMNAYPHIWWHILTCPSCAEQYQAICELLESQRKGEILAVPLLRWNLIHLSRNFLAYALPSPNQLAVLGTAMGPDSYDEMVLVDEQVEKHHVTLSFHAHDKGSWNMIVSVSPIPDGNLVVRLGTSEFRAEFNQHGDARITGVPTQLLIESNVDLAVDVER